ncbi:MAG: hypothetical protein J3T61_06650 [Candidatus Brocadiales bacterium]|nr:hypothetical protein [Candidatus Bathyanammoxibius sp.]
MECKYIEFVPLRNPGKKTRLWNVMSYEDELLGFIQYNTGWRRYVFFPNSPTYYEQDCLRKIADFVEEQTTKLRATWKRKRRKK